MSDSPHQGDAARLEAALERIVHALGRAASLPASDTARADETDARDAAHAAAVDIAQVGARLDGLIAELRGVLGEAHVAAAQP